MIVVNVVAIIPKNARQEFRIELEHVKPAPPFVRVRLYQKQPSGEWRQDRGSPGITADMLEKVIDGLRRAAPLLTASRTGSRVSPLPISTQDEHA